MTQLKKGDVNKGVISVIQPDKPYKGQAGWKVTFADGVQVKFTGEFPHKVKDEISYKVGYVSDDGSFILASTNKPKQNKGNMEVMSALRFAGDLHANKMEIDVEEVLEDADKALSWIRQNS